MENALRKLFDLLLEDRTIEINRVNEQNRFRVTTNHSVYFGDLSTIIFNMQDFISSFSDDMQFKTYVLNHKSNDEFIDLIFTHGNYIDINQKLKLLALLIKYFPNDKDIRTSHIYGFLRLDNELINAFIDDFKVISEKKFKYYDISLVAYLFNNLKFETTISNSNNILKEVHLQIERLYYYSLENLDIKTSITILDYTNQLIENESDGIKYGKIKQEVLDKFADKLFTGSDDNIIEFVKLLPIPKMSIIDSFKREEWVLRPFAADVYISSRLQQILFLTTKSESVIKKNDIDEQKYLLEILSSIPKYRQFDKPIYEVKIPSKKLTQEFVDFLSQNYEFKYPEYIVKSDVNFSS